MGDLTLALQAYERWLLEDRTVAKFERQLMLEDLHTLVTYYIDIDTTEQMFERLESWIDKYHPEAKTVADISDVDS